MSLIDANSILLLRLNERKDGILPSDASGHCADFESGGVTIAPIVSETLTGYGRKFSSGAALKSTSDVDAEDLGGSVSIAALISFDVSAQSSIGTDGTLIQWGDTGSVAIGLRVRVVDAIANKVSAHLYWQGETTEVEDAGVIFVAAPGEFLLVTASRETSRVGKLFCRYSVCGKSYESPVGRSLSVDATDAADVRIGASFSPLGKYLAGTIDQIEVLSRAISASEASALWSRMALDMPRMSQAFKRLVPRGVYSDDPDSAIQLELARQGKLLGVAKNIGRVFSKFYTPGSAFGGRLANLETQYARLPSPLESTEERQLALVAKVSDLGGSSLPDIKARLAPHLGQPASDVQIYRYDAEFNQPFDADDDQAIVIDGNGSWLGPASVAANGSQRATVDAADASFTDGMRGEKCPAYLWSYPFGDDGWAGVTVTSLGASDDDTGGALLIGSNRLDEWLVLGIESGGDLVWASYLDGVLSDFAVIASGVSTPVTLRVQYNGNASYTLRYGATASAAESAIGTTVEGPSECTWFGIAGMSFVFDEFLSLSATFDDVFARSASSHAGLNWYAYRDPTEPGNYNLEAARFAVKTIKQAHTHAFVVDSKDPMKCDNEDHGVDQWPIGGVE